MMSNSNENLATIASHIEVIDTHTGGEPTRVVMAGGPDLGSGSIADRAKKLGESFDHFRSAVVNEPRGSDVMVGALICESSDPTCCAGVIFFNNVGVLGMCGHGTIGIAVALAHAGRIKAGTHTIETNVGNVTFVLHDDLERVTLENVPCYRIAKDVAVDVSRAGGQPIAGADEQGIVKGDIAWGGNWFFLVHADPKLIGAHNVTKLTADSLAIRQALEDAGITGERGEEIDHVELFGPTENPETDSKNFVLCPVAAWDRSPCGTGTSAKIACLAADDTLPPGEVWRQESTIGSVFEVTYKQGEPINGHASVIPAVTGSAWVNGEATLLVNGKDPFALGIRS